jgi:hypothetical protein
VGAGLQISNGRGSRAWALGLRLVGREETRTLNRPHVGSATDHLTRSASFPRYIHVFNSRTIVNSRTITRQHSPVP